MLYSSNHFILRISSVIESQPPLATDEGEIIAQLQQEIGKVTN